MKKATLKQIAEMADVSLTTVHRALNGKGGCSKDVEDKILRIAREQGYTINLAAQSLRKPPMNIALIFPFRDNGGRFYIDRILDGYLEYRREAAQYNLVFQEFLLRSNDKKIENYEDMEYPELETILRNIYQEQPVHFDSVVIYGQSITRRAETMLNRIIGAGTRVVVIERTMEQLEDICTVKSDEKIAGDMAGEILSRAIPEPGTVLIVSQQVIGGDKNARYCEQFIREERPDLKIVQMPLIMNLDESEAILQELEKYPDLVGLYVTSGRHTNSALKAVEKYGSKPLYFIGSEVFEESHQALKARRIDALIDKRPEKIGYMALHVILEAMYRNQDLPEVHNVIPRIVLRSNCDAYYNRKGARFEQSEYTDE